MNLNTTIFSEEECSRPYTTTTFYEAGVNITLLNEQKSSKSKLSSGNNYSFGVIKDGNYYWYFNGLAVAKNREKMREIFGALLEVNKGTKHKPFAYKHKS